MSEVKLYVLDLDSSGPEYPCRPATADEIKAAHPVCGSCKYLTHSIHGYTCTKQQMFYAPDPKEDYCRHHTPKEGV